MFHLHFQVHQRHRPAQKEQKEIINDFLILIIIFEWLSNGTTQVQYIVSISDYVSMGWDIIPTHPDPIRSLENVYARFETNFIFPMRINLTEKRICQT